MICQNMSGFAKNCRDLPLEVLDGWQLVTVQQQLQRRAGVEQRAAQALLRDVPLPGGSSRPGHHWRHL